MFYAHFDCHGEESSLLDCGYELLNSDLCPPSSRVGLTCSTCAHTHTHTDTLSHTHTHHTHTHIHTHRHTRTNPHTHTPSHPHTHTPPPSTGGSAPTTPPPPSLPILTISLAAGLGGGGLLLLVIICVVCCCCCVYRCRKAKTGEGSWQQSAQNGATTNGQAHIHAPAGLSVCVCGGRGGVGGRCVWLTLGWSKFQLRSSFQ